MLQYNIFNLSADEAVITVIVSGDPNSPYAAQNDHPNFKAIVAAAMAGDESVVDRFDIGEQVASRFEPLSERVSVRDGEILFDGDPVHGTLQEQILEFLDADEDFGPLVAFYEKLSTNPLGDVRAGLYDWINGQRANGNFTITPDGDILGYKSVKRTAPEWREGVDEVFVPSRPGEGIVNGHAVKASQFIEQIPGDTVEMPRSRVLNMPSEMCGDGLHIGTYAYASTFYGGDTVMLVQFSPRDIVSLPDSNSAWKLRVCRYQVVGEVSEPLEVPVWSPQGQDTPEHPADAWVSEWDEDDSTVSDARGDDLAVGDRVRDEDGDEGTVVEVLTDTDEVKVKYDSMWHGSPVMVIDAGSVTRL